MNIRASLILCNSRQTLLQVSVLDEISATPPLPVSTLLPTLVSDSIPQWYCLRSQAKREHVAAANLRDRVNVEVFAPRIRAVHSTRHGVAAQVVEALFPGYLFAQFTYPDQVRHVVSTCGVTGIVTFAGRPPAVAAEVIECLRREVSVAARADIAPVLQPGAWVRILSGCFQFLEGRILHFDPQTERVRLLLVLLGSEVQVTLPAQRVGLVDESRTNYPASLIAPSPGSGFRAVCVA